MDLKQHIRHVPDFPKAGILFYDSTTLLRNPAGLEATKIQSLVGGARMTVTGQIAAPALDQLIDQIREDVETMIAAIESSL